MLEYDSQPWGSTWIILISHPKSLMSERLRRIIEYVMVASLVEEREKSGSQGPCFGISPANIFYTSGGQKVVIRATYQRGKPQLLIRKKGIFLFDTEETVATNEDRGGESGSRGILTPSPHTTRHALRLEVAVFIAEL